MNWAAATIAIAKKHNKKCVLFIHSFEAQAMPKQFFKIVGPKDWKWPLDIHFPSNVIYTGTITPEQVYSDTLIFLAPARWNEPFGMCLIEAQINGIPVIASAKGAPLYDNLVDSDMFVNNVDDILEWISKIEQVLENYSNYETRLKGKDFSKYSSTTSINQFHALIEELKPDNPVFDGIEKR